MITSMLDNVEREKLKKKEIKRGLILAIIMILFGTYLFGTKASPLQYTFSMIGNKLGHRLSFVIWGVVTGLLLIFCVKKLYDFKSFKDTRATKLLVWSYIFLLLTVFIPTLETLPILKKIHLVTGVAFGISLMISLFLFLQFIHESNQELYNSSMVLFNIVLFGSIGLYFIVGNTGIFEFFFFYTLSIFLFFLQNKLL